MIENRKRLLSPLFVLLVLTAGIHGCCKLCETWSDGQCNAGEPGQDFDHFARFCTWPGNEEDNSGKESITIGGSLVEGWTCYMTDSGRQCGFIGELEKLSGMEIANFAYKGASTKGVVEGEQGVPFSRVDASVTNNPDAKRVYILIGGNDIFNFVKDNIDLAPRPGDDCRLNEAVAGMMEETIRNLRLIIERYRVFHGIQQVVVGSSPPMEEQSDTCFSCKQLMELFSCNQCHLCLNEMLGVWADMLEDLAAEMGGAGAGIFYADHFSAFPQDPSACSLYCDCAHLNCGAFMKMAEVWNDSVTEVPDPLRPPDRQEDGGCGCAVFGEDKDRKPGQLLLTLLPYLLPAAYVLIRRKKWNKDNSC